MGRSASLSNEPVIKENEKNTEKLIESIGELNSTIKKMDETAVGYSRLMFWLTSIALSVAILQIIFPFLIPSSLPFYVKPLVLAALMLVIYYIIDRVTKFTIDKLK